MLNNLFGVVLRFREREVALVGDISKMYHRVLIPLQDQHVHRFLWRNLDTDRKPDVYIKTVLAFGDKPAPAMAQIDLRKTAQESRATNPDAAEVLANNVYMDDICDFVNTVEKAQGLSDDNDSVLAKGGFSVKGWIWNKDMSKGNEKEKISDVTEVFEGGAEVVKVLGVVGNHGTDDLRFKVRPDLIKASEVTIGANEDATLCIFSDASREAFGSCAYIRQKGDNNKYEVKFIVARSRVAPLKQVTTPCLVL